jgi:hypothetical protein
MNKSITILLLLLGYSCANDKQQNNASKDIAYLEESKTAMPSIKNETLNITDELYNLQIKIETTENNKHNLVVAIELLNGSHFISPYAKRDLKGKFYMDFGGFDNLAFDGNIIETPRSVEEFDEHPFTNGLVNWVRVNTTYKQPLNILSEDDFEVFGRIQFTIEPRCTLEEIPFAISYKDGVMKLFSPKC